MKKEKFEYIDYLKAMIIFIVILVHVGFIKLTGFSNLCMITLFVCSGFTTTIKDIPLREIIFKNFKKIIIPYWIANAVYGIIEIFRGNYFGYGDYKLIYPVINTMIYGAAKKLPNIPILSKICYEALSKYNREVFGTSMILPTNCHLWFLPVLFSGLVIFTIYIHYVKKRGFFDAIMVLILVFLSYFESVPDFIQLPYGLGRGFLASACMIVGFNLRYYKVFELKVRGIVIGIISAIIMFFLYNQSAPKLAFVSSTYPRGDILGVYMSFIVGVSMTILLFFIFKFISANVKCDMLSYIGRNTMTIYLWHMIFLNLYSIIFLKILNIDFVMDIYYMAFIPLNKPGLMILVAVLSLVSCMIIVYICDIMKKKRINL